MSDKEFIIFLCEQILNIIADGDDPDIKVIEMELRKRDINPNDIFIY